MRTAVIRVGVTVLCPVNSSPPTRKQLQQPRPPDLQAGWEATLARIHTRLFSAGSEETSAGTEHSDDDWFLIHEDGLQPGRFLPHLSNSETKMERLKGVIKSVLRPSGGTVETENGRLVKFLRNQIHIAGVRCGLSEVLESVISVDQEVEMDVMQDENAETETCLAVLLGPAEPRQPAEQPDSLARFHRVRVVDLQPDEEGRLVSGLATIQPSPIIRAGEAVSSMLGEWVSFTRENLWFLDTPLQSNIDLGLLVRGARQALLRSF